MLRLTTFGGLALSRDGVALTGAAAQRSRLSLLALLATAGPTGFSRDKLLLYLWPESDDERARHALKQAVYSLRRELGSDEVIVGTASLSLNPVFMSSDAREFETAVAAGDLATAVSLYTGPFLDGFHLKDSSEFERWSAEHRSRFADMWRKAVEKLAGDHSARGEFREAAGYFRKLVNAEPLSGPHTAELMRALAESGDVGAALSQYKIHESLLREELGAAPEPAAAQLAEQLRSGTWVRSPAPPVRPVAPAPTPREASVSALAQPAAGGEQHPVSRSIGTARKRRRRSTALAFVLGMLLMTAAALTVTYATMDGDRRAAFNLIRTRPDAQLQPRQIVVAPFENKTGDQSLDALGDLIADWFSRELGEADFRVVDSRTARIGTKVVGDIPKPLRPSDHVALGEETGSAYVVVGSYYRIGDSLEANINVVDVDTRHTVKSLGPFRGSATSTNDFIGAMLRPTIAYLGAEVDTSAGGLTTKYSSPPSLEAFRRVNSAWEHFFASPRDTTTVFAELDTAARLDPTYATPLLMKAYMLDVKSQWAGVSAIVQRVRPLEPRMSKFEKRALELFEADLGGNALARLGIARRLQEHSPGSSEMPLLRVVSALYIGNVPEAVTALGETDPARGMNLGTPTYLEWGAATWHYAGDAVAEERAVREELKRFRHHPPATFGLARVYATRNDRELASLLDRGIPPATNQNDVRDQRADSIELRLFAARELLAHGHQAEGKRIYARMLEQFWKPSGTSAAPIADRRRHAQVLYESGDYPGAIAAYRSILAEDSTDLESMGRIATASIRVGELPIARQMDERLKNSRRAFLMGAHHRWRASIAAVEGRTEEAVRLLDLAVRGGHRLMDSPPNLTVHLDPDFAAVEKSPAFKTMLEALTEESAAR